MANKKKPQQPQKQVAPTQQEPHFAAFARPRAPGEPARPAYPGSATHFYGY